MKFRLTFSLCASLAFAAAPVFAQTTHLSNLSTRGQVATGGSIMISGFNIPAGADRTVLIRAAGPTLANFAVTGVLANPKLEVYNSANAKIAENDDWGSSTALSNTFASAGAFAFNANSLESAIVLTLPSGGYTAQVSGLNSTAGVALVEVYDLSSGSNYLANLSTRGPVGTGSAVLVAGFNLAPSGTTRRLLIRAVGPTLSTFALTGLLADPKLEVYNSTGTKIAENDDWATVSAPAGSALSADSTTMASAFTKAGAFALASTSSKDAALLIDLPAGGYTAQVSGVGGTTGLALVELYDVTNAGILVTTTIPTITSQPTALSVASGASATFTVAANGNSLGYQWHRAGVAIAGATSSTYTIAAATSADAGNYYVVVSNSAGSITSSTVSLTVTTSTTGSNTAAVVAATQAFLATLSTSQQSTTQLAWSLAAARRWSNLPASSNFVVRNGISWGTLTTAQRAAASAMLATVLSSAGQTLLTGMQAADDYLAANGGGTSYGNSLYFFAIYGTPSVSDFWVLQFTGHHLTYHFTFNGTYKSGTPLFLGVEPRTSFTVNGATYDPMVVQRTAAADLFSTLTTYSAALLSGTYTDILHGANGTGGIDGTYPKAYPTGTTGRGIAYSALSAADQEKAKAFIRAYVNTQATEVATDLLNSYLSDTALASTYVAYAGPASVATANSYLRIDGPRVWIELSVQGGIIIRNEPHYHGIWRDKLADYGGNF